VISVAPNFTLAQHESLDRFGRVVGDHGQAQTARTGVEILRTLAPRLGPAGAAIDHLDRAGDQDFAGGAGLEERVAGAERKLRLVHLDNPFEKIAVGIDHRAPKLLRQKPGRLVGDAELVLQLSRGHAVGMRRHHMRRPEPGRQRQFRPMPAVSEVCRPQSRHSNRRGRLFKATARPLPHPGQTNPSRQRWAERNAAQRASSGNSFWSSASVRPRPTASRSESARP
jgi:hypothetical protein